MLLLACLLAGFIGFSAQRAGFCSVRAVEEVLSTRKFYMVISFGKVILWALGIVFLVASISGADYLVKSGWLFSWPIILGGLLFGVGATLNGGCAFSTLTRLGSGNLGMLLSLAGFSLGIFCFTSYNSADILQPDIEPVTLLSQASDYTLPITLFLCLLMVAELIRIYWTGRQQGWVARWLSPHYRLSTAAMVMGMSNGGLYMLIGVWPYTALLRQWVDHMTSGAPQPAVMLWILFLALVVGIAFSAFQCGRFKWRGRPGWQWLNFSVGGFFMGLGASLIPGGNDVLLFHAAPSLSSHVVPALLSIFVGIAMTLSLLKGFGKPLPSLSCGGDICKAEFDPPEDKA